jgi:glutamate-1-semialdehyde 2,1-aminomutase
MSLHEDLFERATRCIPGGVNSPVRAFGAVGGTPLFFESGDGSKLRDVEGREYIDCVGSWGPLILGHRHPEVEGAVLKAVKKGTTFGAPTVLEVELAELICSTLPSVERVRLTSSGTEAGLSAARLARGFTGRDRIVKFAGCYHGHGDSFLIQAGSGALTLGAPSSPGVPEALANLTLPLQYNDVEGVEGAFAEYGDEIAAVFLEPVAANMGVVPPKGEFLQSLRRLCDQHGALLVFDEVITGYRVGLGGAQGLYGVRPDLTCLGKIVGGGLPVGAFGGRADIFAKLAPDGPIYQAGTLSGNPLATAAGVATLRVLSRPESYPALEEKARRVEAGIGEAIGAASVPVCYQRVASMGTLFFTEGPVTSLASLEDVNTDLYGQFFRGLLERGVYFPPSQYEAFTLSLAHSDQDLERIIAAVTEVLAGLE